MTTRTTSRTVTFRRPFVLTDFTQLAPAGDYIIDTEEHFVAKTWRRVSTLLRLDDFGVAEHRSVDPDELREALIRDGAHDARGGISGLSRAAAAC